MSLSLQIRNKKSIITKDKYIWKYLDLHKYISFIREPNFYLRRLDLFNDITEGMSHQEIFKHNLKTVDIENPESDFEKMIVNLQNSTELDKKEEVDRRYACCFFLGKHESMAMWDIYSQSGSIALKYEPETLISLLQIKLEKQDYLKRTKQIIFNKVRYTDFNKPVKVKYRAFRKNESYRHEQEVRLIVELNEPSKNLTGIHYKSVMPFGGLEIIAHPATSKWQLENLTDMTNKYQPNYTVTESLLSNTLRNSKDF